MIDPVKPCRLTEFASCCLMRSLFDIIQNDDDTNNNDEKYINFIHSLFV